MSVSIVPCPKCGTLLLSDTAQCPSCHHVMDNAAAAETTPIKVETSSATDVGTPPPAQQAGTPPAQQLGTPAPARQDEADEIPCPDCGEMVRKELVRCWQCGAFMRQDIAERYLQMQESPAPVIYSLPPEQGDEQQLLDEILGGDSQVETTEEDDFVLSDSVARAAAQPPSRQHTPVPESPAASASTTVPPEHAVEAPTTEAAAPGDGDEQTAAAADAVGAEREAASETGAEGTGDDEVPHSVKTGGDVLLNIALQEEQELQQRRKALQRRGGRRRPFVPPNGFVIFCPNGHQIVVQERHRGMTGRCPRCKALFIVPQATWTEKKKAQRQETTEKTEQQPVGGRFDQWLRDVRLHIVDPTRLKLKEGALEKAFEPVDIGFSKEEILVLRLVKPGLFGVPEKKRVETREKVLQLLAEQVPVEDLPVEEAQLIDSENVGSMAVVLPTPYPHESMFAGIPVFGRSRIVVRIPGTAPDDATQLRFLSFTLSEFRRFARLLEQRFGIEDFGADMGVPLEDEFEEQTCHYTDQKLQVLQHAELYLADPAYRLEPIGYRCGTCGLVVSEDGRKKEKIGGPGGKGLAKAKCPKCQSKFGVNPLYGPPTLTAPDEPLTETEAASGKAAAAASSDSSAASGEAGASSED